MSVAVIVWMLRLLSATGRSMRPLHLSASACGRIRMNVRAGSYCPGVPGGYIVRGVKRVHGEFAAGRCVPLLKEKEK